MTWKKTSRYLRQQGKELLRAGKKTIQKRYSKKGGINLKQIASDLAQLKILVNVEKKYFDNNGVAQTLGQVNANLTGGYYNDITPIPAQGLTDITRNGDSIKVVTGFYNLQMWTQANSASSMKGCIYIVKNMGVAITASTAYTNYFIANPISTVIDYQSNPNTDFSFMFKTLRKIPFSILQENLSGQVNLKTVKIPMRFNEHHVRYSANSTTVTTGQIFLFIVMDSGNSGLVSTLTNVPIQQTLTGLVLNFDMRHYFVDN